jgi:hypothetical protein
MTALRECFEGMSFSIEPDVTVAVKHSLGNVTRDRFDGLLACATLAQLSY